MLTKDIEPLWACEAMDYSHGAQVHKARRYCWFLSRYDHPRSEMSLLSNHRKERLCQDFGGRRVGHVL